MSVLCRNITYRNLSLVLPPFDDLVKHVAMFGVPIDYHLGISTPRVLWKLKYPVFLLLWPVVTGTFPSESIVVYLTPV